MKTKSENLAHEALHYHNQPPRGKIGTQITKSITNPHELSLAYTPGVAYPVLEIAQQADNAYRYTNKGNMVAVITNGTAILGLGNRGALAAKPVMEGKCMLLKRLADIDAIDLEVNETDPDRLVDLIVALEPSFGGIILEDIKAPECFYIEQRLRERLTIPMLHDDQYGTAVVTAAAVINGLKITGKKIEHLQVVINGAGSAAIGCAQLLIALGLPREHLVMCDSMGVITLDRPLLSDQKRRYATHRKLSTLSEAINGADLFIGVSKGGVLTPEMVATMADQPIVLALANPDPELPPHLLKSCRTDMLYATGRSDLPNQVNNVLGFPYILRGLLDVGARTINNEMLIAATHALAALAEEPVPKSLQELYTDEKLVFGAHYLLPKPFDGRLTERIAEAVARAAIHSGQARHSIDDWDEYRNNLHLRMASCIQ